MKFWHLHVIMAVILAIFLFSLATCVRSCTKAVSDGSAGKAIGGFVKEVREAAE